MVQWGYSILSKQNEVLRSFLICSSFLVLKMMFMSIFTGTKRWIYKAFVNPEDAIRFRAEPKYEENVERVRRAHLNDIENISLFFIIGLLYTLTNPATVLAESLFLIYTIARIVHTVVYAVWPLPQPARGLSWSVGYLITGFMAAFSNPEDAKQFQAKPKIDDNVERVRRAHLNDVENIPLFFVAGLLYTLTNPAAILAKSLFLAYTVARVMHTFVYAVCPLPQPARGLSWFVGYLITGFMAVRSFIYFM
ncbi:unnamed protein product [Psylliodes chrysocephalus]|uniref:Microsomal glutathione S-transferase 1 n=1 Tax=Psylliodes chrysocephalus TaxID=3402493 RepID=A0A9P0CIN1_9CUCU|nr:unnamed protein product [Psylliodes chrysocephala]